MLTYVRCWRITPRGPELGCFRKQRQKEARSHTAGKQFLWGIGFLKAEAWVVIWELAEFKAIGSGGGVGVY